MNRPIPRIVIGGTWSGCGKTTVARGLMAACVARGLTVQPFKVGPDFIDPSHHTAICGRISQNLDPFMMGEAEVGEVFARASEGADLAIVEGVMGLFDGVDGGSCFQHRPRGGTPLRPRHPRGGAPGDVRVGPRGDQGYSTFLPGNRACGVHL